MNIQIKKYFYASSRISFHESSLRYNDVSEVLTQRARQISAILLQISTWAWGSGACVRA